MRSLRNDGSGSKRHRIKMTVNYEKIITLTGVAKEAVGLLHTYKVQSDDEILLNPEKLGNIKYQFIVAVEACIDICNHIASKQFSQAPESYAHCFAILREQGIVSPDLAERMSDLAKFRNVIVHLYWKVDNLRVIQILKNEMDSINEFLNTISDKFKNPNPDT